MSRVPFRPCSVHRSRFLTKARKFVRGTRKICERNKKDFIVMRGYVLCLSFLALASSQCFGLSWGSLVWLGGRQAEAEKPEVVEVVRWRQPVCVLPAKGVRSCLSGLSNLQKEYERANGKEFEKEQKKLDEFVNKRGSKIYEDVLRDDSDLRSMYELFEQLRPSEEDIDAREDKDHPMAKRTAPLPEKIVQENTREAKYFTASSDKPNLIYVTKVLNAPVTATLVALNCMPDVGIPLCEDDESLKNAKLSEEESKVEEVDGEKLVEMLAKQQSVVDVIRQMIGKPGESRTTEEKPESSKTLNPSVDEDSKRLQGLELAEILLEKDNNDSGDSNRDKRHLTSMMLDKFKDFFNKSANNEQIVVKDPVYVVNSSMQYPWWGMLQKHYSVLKKPIFVYEKPFNQMNIFEWLLPKIPIDKVDFFQDIFEHIQRKKLPIFYDDQVPLESQMSFEKVMNPEDGTTTSAGNPSKPVDGTESNN